MRKKKKLKKYIIFNKTKNCITNGSYFVRIKYEKYQYEAELNNKIQNIENVNKSRRTKYEKYTMICKFN